MNPFISSSHNLYRRDEDVVWLQLSIPSAIYPVRGASLNNNNPIRNKHNRIKI